MNEYNLDVARNEQQRKQMQELSDRSVCAFCRENIETEQKQPIEYESDHWVVKKNDYPYKNTHLHLLLIPKYHVRTISELPLAARQDYLETVIHCEKHWDLKSYALGFRSGDMRLNGGSVAHLHSHIIVGDTSATEHEPVRFKMSSRPDSKNT